MGAGRPAGQTRADHVVLASVLALAALSLAAMALVCAPADGGVSEEARRLLRPRTASPTAPTSRWPFGTGRRVRRRMALGR
jgi:hypothetical protein